jgi:hypothetical protein
VESKWKNSHIITFPGQSLTKNRHKSEMLFLETKLVSEENLEGRTEVTGRRGRRRKQLMDDLKERRGYWKLKEEALDRTVWRTRFGRGYGSVVRQTTELLNENTRKMQY